MNDPLSALYGPAWVLLALCAVAWLWHPLGAAVLAAAALAVIVARLVRFVAMGR